MREKLQPWIPAIFCATLSLITFVAVLAMSVNTKPDGGLTIMAGLIPFLSFLPMCFYHVGAVTSRLRQENRELRERILKLSGEKNDIS